ncbi:Hsp20/alpha crystallin family protein [Halosolutus amylolyticus]|uniref:Hsp20/alpha crystallin family protein n=1 Tax=Halosolutus amylolyticus TaxID=2932267 RepID=A0ABD5PVE5_9EURY|nr:Hsp20/alpha crystallin family protein [Halosolutus amylolyticus]
MSDDRPPAEDDSSADGTPDDGDDRTGAGGFRFEAGLRSLTDLLDALVDVTVTDALPPPAERADRSTDPRGRSGDDPGRASDGDRSNGFHTTGRRPTPAAEHLVDSRRADGEFVVTADVPGASRDDLSVRIDPRTSELVITVSGTVLERVATPWRSVEATRVRFNNGVLEVRLRSADS